ncbi:TIR domain-containing protein [Sphingomonas sp.]|uniref:TIR domain-containing protein n=1 Tax=Sphingomonas sp. TaxID=28214 RepID=UPI00286AC3F2|nr:TIR domain-containing protein [Sphingomonas sp.]
MAKVFLSYAREDAPAAKQLAESIGRAGHEVWWDRHIQGGSRFSSEIDRELKSAAVVVVLWSPTSIESAWVQDEAAEGRDSGRLVPVSLGGSRAPLGFRQFHTVDLANWSGAGEPAEIDDLLDAIAKTAGNSAAAATTAQASEPKVARGPSVCVLPFVNMSGDPEQEYFSDGITEDIITDLSKVSALLVIARNTAFTFKGKVMDVKEVAQALDVSHVLEGSVRKAGDRVRITGQLIDAATGGHLWADRYDRDLTDIFAIQDEISKAIVAALRVKLLPEEKKAMETRGTASVEAYNLYLMARQQWTDGGIGDVRCQETIVRICRQAISFDPDYAQAWALMALAQSQMRFWHGMDADPQLAAERALAINPNLAEAHCVKAHLLEEEGKPAEATAEIETAVRLDPESWEVNREAARLIFRQGRIADSIPYFEKAASLMESDWHNPSMLITCYQGVGTSEQLLRAARVASERTEKAIAKDPSNTAVLAAGASALAIVGEDQRARDWIERALLLDPDNIIMRYNLACALTGQLADPDRAIEVLEPYFDKTVSATHIRHADVDPDLDSVRDHPRFKEMLSAAKQRLGIAEAAA